MGMILQEHSIVVCSQSMWSATAKIKDEDLSSTAGRPPKGLGTLGTLSLIDRSHLSVFNGIKGRVWHYMRRAGLPFIGHTLVRDDRVALVQDNLRQFAAEWADAVEDLRANLPVWVDDWCAQYPEWESVIRGKLPASTADIVRRFGFGYEVFHLSPSPEQEAGVEQTLVNSARERLCAEFAERLADCEKAKDTKSGALPQGIRTVLKDMKERCAALALMNPDAVSFGTLLTRAEALVDNVEPWLARAVITGIVRSLSSPETAETVLSDIQACASTAGYVSSMVEALRAPAVEQEDIVAASEPQLVEIAPPVAPAPAAQTEPEAPSLVAIEKPAVVQQPVQAEAVETNDFGLDLDELF